MVKDRNEIRLSGVVQNIQQHRGWKTIQLATESGGGRNRENGRMTPIIHVFDVLQCPNFGIGAHLSILAHIQPFKTSSAKGQVMDIIAADIIEFTKRALTTDFKFLKAVPEFEEFNGGHAEDVNRSAFLGTVASFKIRSSQDILRGVLRLTMATPDITTGTINANTCSIICYGRQAEYLRDNARNGSRVCVSAVTRTLKISNSGSSQIIQQQAAKDVFILSKENILT